MFKSFANQMTSGGTLGHRLILVQCEDSQIAEQFPLMAGSVSRYHCCDWVGVTCGFKCLEWLEESRRAGGWWILRVNLPEFLCFLAGSGWLWEATSGD